MEHPETSSCSEETLIQSAGILWKQKRSRWNMHLNATIHQNFISSSCCERFTRLSRFLFYTVQSLSLSVFFLNLSLLFHQVPPQQERVTALTVCSKVCFAIGGAPYQITGSALGFFLQIFLLDVAQVSRGITILPIHRIIKIKFCYCNITLCECG